LGAHPDPQSPTPSVGRAGQRPDSRRHFAAPWERIEDFCMEVRKSGDWREGRRDVQRLLARADAAVPNAARFAAQLFLAEAGALLGELDEAAGRLRAARRLLAPLDNGQSYLDWLVASLELDWARRDRARLTRTVRVLMRWVGQPHSSSRLEAGLFTAGRALANLGEQETARRCIAALDDLAQGRCQRGHWQAAALAAELAYREALESWASAGIAATIAPGPVELPVSARRRASAAHEGYQLALLGAQGEGCVVRAQLQSGCDKSRLLLVHDPACLARLEEYHGWMRKIACEREIIASRNALAVAYLANQQFARAAHWFEPEVGLDAVPMGAELYLACVAHEGCGDRRAALRDLKRYLAQASAHVGARRTEPRRIEGAPTAGGQGAQHLVTAALELAQRHLATPLSVARLAQMLGVSRRTLEYAFRAVASTSPKRALTELRLDEVRRQLAPDCTVRAAALESVARQSGFVSYQAFARAVRVAYSIAPSGLRGHIAKES
jgi:AraC-like DNA-binding protein